MTATTISTTNETTERKKFQLKNVIALSIGHGTGDLYTGMFFALLPVIINSLSLTNTAGGALSVFRGLPSILQPVIGRFADRKDLRILVSLSPAVIALFMTLLGISSSYAMIAFFLMMAGLSVASLHAIGPVLAGRLSGEKLGLGMSFWMFCGETGRVLGPLAVVTLLKFAPISYLPLLMIPGILVSIFVYFALKSIPPQENHISDAANQDLKVAWAQIKPTMFPLAILILTAAPMLSAVTTYLPIYMIEQGKDLWLAGASVSIIQAAGAIGAFLTGPVSDHHGRRITLLVTRIAAPLFLLLFIPINGISQYFLLIAIGLTALSTTPIMMALTQESSEENRSLANGIYMAINFVIGSFAVLLVGFVIDHLGMEVAFTSSAILCLVSLPFIFLLPKDNRK